MDELQKLKDLLDQNDKLLKAIKDALEKITGVRTDLEKDTIEPKLEEDTNSTSGYKIVYVWNYSK